MTLTFLFSQTFLHNSLSDESKTLSEKTLSFKFHLLVSSDISFYSSPETEGALQSVFQVQCFPIFSDKFVSFHDYLYLFSLKNTSINDSTENYFFHFRQIDSISNIVFSSLLIGTILWRKLNIQKRHSLNQWEEKRIIYWIARDRNKI